MEKVLISACLAGKTCAWNGKHNYCKKIQHLLDSGEAVLVCPEQAGGLSTPRDPSELIGDKVVSVKGKDVTSEFNKGAQEALRLARENNIKKAILKANSPSCGNKHIYDGTFSDKLVPGMGVTARLLVENGIKVISEEEL